MLTGCSGSLTDMEAESVTASTTIDAAPEAVFAVLADPSTHRHRRHRVGAGVPGQ